MASLFNNNNISTSGQVTIGTHTIRFPSVTQLEVASNRTFLSANNEPYALGVRYVSGVNTGAVYFGAASSSSTPDARISNAGGSELIRFKNTGQTRFYPLLSDPSGAEAGDVYYNSSTNKLRLYNGSSWVDLN